MGEPLTVALPLGIGDAHWCLMKLRALKAMHPGRPLHAFINKSDNHLTVGYLEIVPFIDHAETSDRAPFCITTELPGTYKDPRYQTLDGCRDWNGFDFVFCANHAMESGVPIADWIPELATDYRLSYAYPVEALNRREALMPSPGTVLLYPSGTGPNEGFHGNWWTVQDWAEVVRLLNGRGIEPLFVGAPTQEDMGYWARIEPLLAGMRWRSVVGRTSIPDYLLLIERARCWCGLNSGGGIVSASCEVPTVMMWADARWKVGPGAWFDPLMQRAWLHPERRDHYRTASYGDPETTPQRIVDLILEVLR